MNPVSISNSEHYVWGEKCDGWHLLKRDDMSIIQELVPAGAAELLHYHRQSRQFFYMLSGTGTMLVGDERVVLKQGEGIEIAPLIAHQLRNESTEAALFLVISVPKSHGDRVNVA